MDYDDLILFLLDDAADAAAEADIDVSELLGEAAAHPDVIAALAD